MLFAPISPICSFSRLDIGAEKTKGLIISRDVFLSDEEEVPKLFQLSSLFLQISALRFVDENIYFLNVPRTLCLLFHEKPASLRFSVNFFTSVFN